MSTIQNSPIVSPDECIKRAIIHKDTLPLKILLETGETFDRIEKISKKVLPKTSDSKQQVKKLLREVLVWKIMEENKTFEIFKKIFAFSNPNHAENYLHLFFLKGKPSEVEKFLTQVPAPTEVEDKVRFLEIFHRTIQLMPEGSTPSLKAFQGHLQSDEKAELFHMACYKGFSPLVDAMIEAGIDPNILHPESRSTPLYTATYAGEIKMVRMLLSKKVDVNLGNRIHQTPLHVAAIEGHLSIAKLLLGSGANRKALSEGKTPLECAQHNEHQEVAKFLQDF